ncbi:putative RNA-directed DNA polymerase from transposon BS [Trichonephila clavipes]|nr:putative RNA-directed DNA polymerase from transposon BS [Trichonephila clavipes]
MFTHLPSMSHFPSVARSNTTLPVSLLNLHTSYNSAARGTKVSAITGCKRLTQPLCKRRAWFLPDVRHTASLVEIRGGWRHGRTKLFFSLMDPMQLCPGKDLVLPTLNVDELSKNSRFLLISLPNNELSKKSQFAIHKGPIGIGGKPKSVKRLRSWDLLIETSSAVQTKSFLLSKSFLHSPVTISLHKTLNSCRGVISEPDLLTPPEAEILEGFSNQVVIQTDENITKIKCPPLNLLQPLSSLSKTNYHYPLLLLPHHHLQPKHTSCHPPIAATLSEPHPPIPMSSAVLSTTNNMLSRIESSSINLSASSSNHPLHLL